ncbi:hypothetical protein D9757_002900 [Collybiopsis confluens]|uniref:Uncharacterized protein n=1 Tax=Collybiopsis confluens TaxID=2823264 RepID=A0A8H5ME49_9AGAR|nr:hypothetical protein D9757_002900 [Collybiopsis confluens]
METGACGTTNTARQVSYLLTVDPYTEHFTATINGIMEHIAIKVSCSIMEGEQSLLKSQISDLFANLAGGDPNQIGQVSGSWSFADEAPPPSSTTTHTHSTSTTETPTSTPTPSSSSSSSSSTSSWTSSSSMSSSSSSSSVSTTSTSSTSSTSSATPSATPSGLFVDIHQVLIQLGEIAAIAYLENSSS